MLNTLLDTYSQQTQGIDPMLIYCWTTVFDAGPTLNQHWVDAFCLPGTKCHTNVLCLLGCLLVCHSLYPSDFLRSSGLISMILSPEMCFGPKEQSIKFWECSGLRSGCRIQITNQIPWIGGKVHLVFLYVRLLVCCCVLLLETYSPLLMNKIGWIYDVIIVIPSEVLLPTLWMYALLCYTIHIGFKIIFFGGCLQSLTDWLN